jgi:RNA polymerase sigma-70 factor (ECF subfamily)
MVALEKGDHDLAFRLIVPEYQERLYWHIRKMLYTHDETDDLLQEVFIKVWKNLDKFRRDSSLYTWLYRIATNEVLGFLRKKRLDTQSLEEGIYDALHDPIHFEGNEVERRLQEALAKLPDQQKLVFNMKYFDDMTMKEIAHVLDLSIGGVKSNYHHAVKKIEQYIKLEE